MSVGRCDAPTVSIASRSTRTVSSRMSPHQPDVPRAGGMRTPHASHLSLLPYEASPMAMIVEQAGGRAQKSEGCRFFDHVGYLIYDLSCCPVVT
jgi:hypothetical protein